jgi:hypothetical protein
MGRAEDQHRVGLVTRPVASTDYRGWSLYGAPWLQPVAIHGKSDRRGIRKSSENHCGMSATRMLRKLLTWSRSRGGARVTVGLSSVGGPPTLMMIQLFASATIVGSPFEQNLAAEDVGVEAARARDVRADDEVREGDALAGPREVRHR